MAGVVRRYRGIVTAAVLSLGTPLALTAQATGAVRGTVTDAASGQPVSDARVSIEHASSSTATLATGRYLILGLPARQYVLVVHRVGFAVARADAVVTAGDTVQVDVALHAAAVTLDAVVVSGTGAPAERRVLGNTIESVPGDAVNAAAGATTVDQALQGKLTGAVISQSSGVPGGGISVRLRGTSTILGSAEPLWVVDGVIVDNSSQALVSLGANAGRGNAALSNRLSDIAPGDIDRIEVLKGAAAAALYGSRASSGVIQIFTQRGRQGPPRVSISTEAGLNESPKRYSFNMVPQAGWADVVYGGADSLGAPVQRYDIQDSIWRTAASTVTRLSVSGGSGSTTYYLAGDYDAQQAIIQAEGRHHSSLSGNLSQALRDNLTLRLSGDLIQTHSDYLPEGEQTQGAITNLIFTPTSVKPFYDPNLGRYPYNPVIGPNPFTVLHTFQAPEDVTRFRGSADLSFQPVSGVTLRYLVGLDDYRQEDKYLQPPFSTSATFTGSIQNPIKQQRDVNMDVTATDVARISSALGLTSTLGYRYTSTHSDVLSVEVRNLPVGQTDLNGATPLASQSLADLRTVSGFAEERMSVADRLFVTGGLNVEAASAFGPDERWQLYPRASASWLLDEEGGTNTLRLRLAYGETGGQPPNPYAQFDNYVNVAYTGKPGLVASSLAGNPGLRPERQREIEGGLDLGLFHERASAELTYYHRRTSDLVLQVPLDPTTGQAFELENVGVLSDHGWEAAFATVNVNRPNFTWRTRLSLAHDRNRVDRLNTATDTLVFDYLNAVIPGQPIGVFFGGYYARNPDGSIAYAPVVDTMKAPKKTVIDTVLLPLRARDTVTIAGRDTAVLARRVLGDPNPSLVASFGNTFDLWRRVQLAVLLEGRFGNKVANFTRRIEEYFGAGSAVAGEITGDTIPRTYTLNASRLLTYEEYIEDGGFVKLREVSLTVHFEGRAARWFGAHAMDVRLAGRNLYTWTKYRGLDPEVNLFAASTVSRGVDFANTPIPRTFTLSVSLTL